MPLNDDDLPNRRRRRSDGAMAGPAIERDQLITRIRFAQQRANRILSESVEPRDIDCESLAIELVNASSAAVFLAQDFEPTDDEINLVDGAMRDIIDVLDTGMCFDEEAIEGSRQDLGILLRGMRTDLLREVELADENFQRRVFHFDLI